MFGYTFSILAVVGMARMSPVLSNVEKHSNCLIIGQINYYSGVSRVQLPLAAAVVSVELKCSKTAHSSLALSKSGLNKHRRDLVEMYRLSPRGRAYIATEAFLATRDSWSL